MGSIRFNLILSALLAISALSKANLAMAQPVPIIENSYSIHGMLPGSTSCGDALGLQLIDYHLKNSSVARAVLQDISNPSVPQNRASFVRIVLHGIILPELCPSSAEYEGYFVDKDRDGKLSANETIRAVKLTCDNTPVVTPRAYFYLPQSGPNGQAWYCAP